MRVLADRIQLMLHVLDGLVSAEWLHLSTLNAALQVELVQLLLGLTQFHRILHDDDVDGHEYTHSHRENSVDATQKRLWVLSEVIHIIIEHVEYDFFIVPSNGLHNIPSVLRKEKEGAATASAFTRLRYLLAVFFGVERLNHVLVFDAVEVHDFLELYKGAFFYSRALKNCRLHTSNQTLIDNALVMLDVAADGGYLLLRLTLHVGFTAVFLLDVAVSRLGVFALVIGRLRLLFRCTHFLFWFAFR